MTGKVDILQIDERIKREFMEQYDKLPEYEKRLEDMHETLDSVSSPKYQLELTNGIYEHLKLIQKIESKEDYNFYLSESTLLIEEYKKILQIPVQLSYTGKIKVENPEKTRIIHDYLKIAKKYATVADCSKKTKSIECIQCNKD